MGPLGLKLISNITLMSHFDHTSLPISDCAKSTLFGRVPATLLSEGVTTISDWSEVSIQGKDAGGAGFFGIPLYILHCRPGPVRLRG
jgi:hypothetical protein